MWPETIIIVCPFGDGHQLLVAGHRRDKRIAYRSIGFSRVCELLAKRFPENAVRLPRAVSAIFNRIDDPWTGILQALFAGNIQHWFVNRPGLSLLERVYINDLKSLRLILAQPKEAFGEFHTVPLSKREVALSTRLQAAGLIRATQKGLLAPPFTRESVVKFRSVFEPSSLLTVRLPLVNPRRQLRPDIRDALLAARIEPEITYSTNATVWRRSDVESYFGDDLIACID